MTTQVVRLSRGSAHKHTYKQTSKERKRARRKETKNQPRTHTWTILNTCFFFSGALHERLCSMLSGQCRRGNTFIILKCGLLVSLYSNISYIPHHHLLGIKIWIRFDLRVSLPIPKQFPIPTAFPVGFFFSFPLLATQPHRAHIVHAGQMKKPAIQARKHDAN